MLDWSVGVLEFFKDYYLKNKDFIDSFATFPSNHLSLVRKDGALDLYHGVLRAVDAEGNKVLDDVDYQEYENYIEEEVRSWSYMKFPYIKSLGKEKGWYRVGPLARLNTCEFIPTPLAQAEFEEYKTLTNGKPNNNCLHYHYARLIELLHSAEMMKELLNDPNLMEGE
ncbi:MAG: Ni/Fe hydrogenase subunit alpha, partial [Anaerolineales bacterium]